MTQQFLRAYAIAYEIKPIIDGCMFHCIHVKEAVANLEVEGGFVYYCISFPQVQGVGSKA